MPKRDSDIHIVSLTFGGAQATSIEGEENPLIEDLDGISEFRFLDTGSMRPSILCNWVKNRINIVFDGDLDNPDHFSSIKAIGIYGPTYADYGYGGLILSNLSIYLEVRTPKEDLDEDMIDDLFHLVALQVRDGSTCARYKTFIEYYGEIEDILPSEAREISVEWNS